MDVSGVSGVTRNEIGTEVLNARDSDKVVPIYHILEDGPIERSGREVRVNVCGALNDFVTAESSKIEAVRAKTSHVEFGIIADLNNRRGDVISRECIRVRNPLAGRRNGANERLRTGEVGDRSEEVVTKVNTIAFESAGDDQLEDLRDLVCTVSRRRVA